MAPAATEGGTPINLPLGDLRVLDLSQVMAGPFCAQLLGDMGADVVKVEPPGGDQARRAMGFTMKGEDTAAFLAVNRNKRSAVLDLKHDAQRAAFHRLAAGADVLLENFRPGVTERLGIDYDTLSAANPGLIYASISGFGQTGPAALHPGYDLIAQGMAGVMSVTGRPGDDPVKCGVPIGDLSAGLFCAFAILAAYVARGRTGRGQRIDTSLFEGALALSIWETAELWATGRVPEPMGSAHRLTAPYQALRTRDGHVTVAGNNERLWRRLCAAIGRDELADDPRFATNHDRMANRPALVAELETRLRTRGTDHWVRILREAGVPVGPINDYRDVLEDPHTHAREMVVEMEHPVEGTVRGLGIPVKLSETPGGIRRAAPLLGQHTAEVLRELGYAEAEIADLQTASAGR
jgi:crotonobetainyl-CoA:carnitine CoA-transferase CaiB-like acyl-CoA transferase